MNRPRIITEDLGGAPLSRAARAAGVNVTQWYRSRPVGREEWRRYLQEVSKGFAGSTWLDRLRPALGSTSFAMSRLERVAAAGGVVVSSGQQAALFGGPLYTIVKAISALALADAFERDLGVPAAPVFWGATDDADFDEARCATVAVEGGLDTLCIESSPPEGTPLSGARVGDASDLIARLTRACGSAADADILDAVREAYADPATTVGSGFIRLLRALLEPLGVAVLDAGHAAVRAASAPAMRRALERAPVIERTQRELYDAIVGAGLKPQVELVPGLSLVFAERDGLKQRVSLSEIESAMALSPETLSANVLLRPVVERAILPSAAYMAGPAELAYFAQVSAVAAVLDVPMPLALPRWSATIVEPRTERLLQRLGVERSELEERDKVEGRLARAALPSGIAEALRTLRRGIEGDVTVLEAADSGEVVPKSAVHGLRGALLHRMDRLERRYVAAMKRREADIMRDVATLRAALYPNGSRQERVLNFIPFLARYGRPLLIDMLHEAGRHVASLIGAVPVRPIVEAGPLAPLA